MANFLEQKDRRVIPNWRSFIQTLKLGELKYSKKGSPISYNMNLSIEDYLLSWEKKRSISIAGDLISAAYVNGFVDKEEVNEAAEYILHNKKKATSSLTSIAKIVLDTSYEKNKEDSFDIENNSFIKNIYKKIKNYKKIIVDFPYNPIVYVDLSRLYSIAGLENKAIKNMKIALHLAPENRFILRAAARLFAHFKQFDYIHNLIRRSDLVYIDPWITSTEIALATILDKRSKLIKIGINMINSNNHEWKSLTELASSIGTIEFIYGNRKKAKKYLKLAVISPNDNSIAQIEWINNRDLLLNINPSDYDISNNYEAIALYEYFNKDYEHAFDQCKKWFYDLPFSKRPVIFGSHIATTLLDKPNIATKFLKEGLNSNPRDAQIINNLAYSLVLDNKINEAEKYIKKITDISNISINTKICLVATQGLISFRKGQIKEGIRLYEKAIDGAKVSKKKYLIWLAKMNYARELIINKSAKSAKIENLISNIPNDTKFPDINKLKKEVINIYKKNKDPTLKK